MADWRYTAGSVPAFVAERCVVVVVGDRDAAEAIARVAAASAAGELSLDRVVDLVLNGRAVSAAPSFFAALRRDDWWHVVIRGALELRGDAGESLSGTDAATWREVRVPVDAELELRVPATAEDPWQNRGDGSVRVGGLRWSGEGSPQPRRAVPGPDAEPIARPGGVPESALAAVESTVNDEAVGGPRRRGAALDLPSTVVAGSRYDALFNEDTVVRGVAAAIVPDEPREPSPGGAVSLGDVDSGVTVSAVLCAQRHPNPPERTACWRCAARLESTALVRVARPPLGRILLADGRQVSIDRAILIGRNPRAERAEAADLPTLIAIGADVAGVSRTHLRVFPSGWQVLVEDLGSSYGTSIRSSDGSVRRLRPAEPVIVSGTCEVDLGGGARLAIVEVP